MSPARTTRLAGTYDELAGDDSEGTNIEHAVRIEHEDGRMEFVIHEVTDDE